MRQKFASESEQIMGWFSKKDEPVWDGGPTHGEVQNYLTGYRLGFPVDEDKPGKRINQDNEMFQRGLHDGKHAYEEKERFLVEHPEYRADVSSEEEEKPARRGFFGLF